VTLKEKILFHEAHPSNWPQMSSQPPYPSTSSGGMNLRWVYLFISSHRLSDLHVLRYANLRNLKGSEIGLYLLRYMTPAAQATRLVGDLTTVVGAWFHAPFMIVGGIAIIIAAWSYGLLWRQ
jgi:hypothetical protein